MEFDNVADDETERRLRQEKRALAEAGGALFAEPYHAPVLPPTTKREWMALAAIITVGVVAGVIGILLRL